MKSVSACPSGRKRHALSVILAVWMTLLFTAFTAAVCLIGKSAFYADVPPDGFGAFCLRLASRLPLPEALLARIGAMRLQGRDVLAIGLAFVGAAGLGCILVTGKDRVLRFICRYRRVLSAVFVALCVLLEINNSSLAQWSVYLGSTDLSDTLFGVPRMIRSDEWAIWTPAAIAQEYGGYPGISTLLSPSGTDAAWISVGGVPARNAALLFKPLYWGFLLLGSAKGLSFLFAMRTVLTFGVSFALAMRYTHQNRVLSILAGVMLLFAPYVQWFFSQSISEVLIFGQLLILLSLAYPGLTGWRRPAAALGIAWCLGCYVMIAYPSWIVSVMYLVLPLAVLCFVRQRHLLRRRDLLLLSVPVLAVLGWLARIVIGTWPALQAVRDSVYPGSRVMTGGNVTPGFASGLLSLTFPVAGTVSGNVCEHACFLTFAPAGLVMAADNMRKSKKADAFSLILIAAELFFGLFMLFGLPEALARVTLLSLCNRLEPAVGLADAMLLIRNLSRKREWSLRFRLLFAAACTLLNTGIVAWKNQSGTLLLLLLAAAYFCLFLLLGKMSAGSRCMQRTGAFVLALVLMMGGAFVNPLQRGIGCAENLELVQALKTVEDGPSDVYAVEGTWPVTDVCMLAGKTCVNTTDFYPDVPYWAQLDPAGTYEEIYNRFCHVSLTVSEDGPSFELRSTDHIRVCLTPADLAVLHVTYLITDKEYEALSGYRFEKVAAGNGMNIYHMAADAGK